MSKRDKRLGSGRKRYQEFTRRMIKALYVRYHIPRPAVLGRWKFRCDYARVKRRADA